MSCPVFTDIVYQKIKDLYGTLFDDDDDNDVNLDNIDDSVFGFDMDSNNSIIGHIYIFLATIFNLIDVKMDRTPIIDTKGDIQGYVRYQLGFQIFEQFGNIEVTDLIEYETLSELVGKRIKLKFYIKNGENLPKKLCSKTFCQYEFFH